MSDWWIDETPPRDPPEAVPLPLAFSGFAASLKAIGVSISRAFGRSSALHDAMMRHNFTLMPPPPVGKPPKPAVVEKRPFPHDPPTNRVYPTSFDNWFREYDHPVRSSQLRVNKPRSPRRR